MTSERVTEGVIADEVSKQSFDARGDDHRR